MSKPKVDTQELGRLFKEALSHQNNADYQQAEKCYIKILEVVPNHADTLHYLGLVKHLTGENQEALEYLNKAKQYAPNDAEISFNLGCIHQELNIWQLAVNSYQNTINLNSKHAMAHNNLAVVLNKIGDKKGFNQHAKKAYALNPNSYEIIVNYATYLTSNSKFIDAITMYKQALTTHPDDNQVLINLCINLQKTWQHKVAAKYLAKTYFSPKNSPANNSSILYLMHYDASISPETVFQRHAEWGKLVQENISPNEIIPIQKRTTGQKIRIGYISPDFKNHAVANFIEPLLEHHNKTKFEIYAYNNNNGKPDQVTDRLKPSFSHWKDIALVPDDKLYKTIRNDKIDILIDLAGHTANNRLMVFAKRAAPVQISYLGYPNTTGLSNMDYRITDQWADPSGSSDKIHTEKLLRLENGFLCYKPRNHCPPVGPLPAVTNNYITFGSFNNAMKINDEVVELWCDVLRQLPTSQLLLKNAAYTDQAVIDIIHSRFESYGIDKERIILHPFIKDDYESIDLYNQMDIALDTFPYNGTTTTSESLWMGVPVITLIGDSHVSRVSYSILNQIGLAELACSSKKEFINKAKAIANDIAYLEKMRNGLRDKCKNSTFTNSELFTNNLEEKLSQLL